MLDPPNPDPPTAPIAMPPLPPAAIIPGPPAMIPGPLTYPGAPISH